MTASQEDAGTIRAQIQSATATFSPAEAKVGRVLLAEYPLAGLETASKLAARAGVSGPTVVRFATRIGFEGFLEFQNALRKEVQERWSSPLSLLDRGKSASEDDPLGASEDVFTRGIRRTFAELPKPEYEAVVDLLADQKRPVACLGGRFSQILAYYLAAHLNMLRADTRAIGLGPTPIADELIDIGRRDVLVVFDYRRHQRDVIDAALRAHDHGTTIVLFTDPWLSPVADIATRVLTSRVEAPSPFDSLVPSLMLVETVVAGLSAKLGETAKGRIEKLERLRSGSTFDRPADLSERNGRGT